MSILLSLDDLEKYLEEKTDSRRRSHKRGGRFRRTHHRRMR
jgi:hypothetical protein